MTVTKQTLDFVKKWEGWSASAYPDPVSHGEPYTIGYGHTSAAGAPAVRLGMTITQVQAESILAADLGAVQAKVLAMLHVSVNDNELSALDSFAFNLGTGALEESTLLKKLNAGDYAGAADEFLRWDHAGGAVIGGLTRRRRDERALFLSQPAAASPATTAIVAAAGAAASVPAGVEAGFPWWAIILLAGIAIAIVYAAFFIWEHRKK